ncbi:MAG: hypothetical protein GY838_04605 [bacterium]|nr:hypothetical protein [bacterium]
MNTTAVRRLPSADWIAFGIGVVALCLQYVHTVGIGLVSLAVFAPSLLREVGLLRDTDEWSRGIMHRAGFHGLLAVAGLYILGYAVSALGLFVPSPDLPQPLNDEIFRKAMVWVFLVSYLIQYWGAREGVFRILLVSALASVLGTVTVLTVNRQEWDFWNKGLLGVAVFSTLFVGVAFLTRRYPRTGGGVLLILLLVLIVFGLFQAPGMSVLERWGMVHIWMQAGLIFGITGIALLRESS